MGIENVLMVEMEIECESERIVIVYYRVKQIGRGVRMNVCQKSEKSLRKTTQQIGPSFLCSLHVIVLSCSFPFIFKSTLSFPTQISFFLETKHCSCMCFALILVTNLFLCTLAG